MDPLRILSCRPAGRTCRARNRLRWARVEVGPRRIGAPLRGREVADRYRRLRSCRPHGEEAPSRPHRSRRGAPSRGPSAGCRRFPGARASASHRPGVVVSRTLRAGRGAGVRGNRSVRVESPPLPGRRRCTGEREDRARLRARSGLSPCLSPGYAPAPPHNPTSRARSSRPSASPCGAAGRAWRSRPRPPAPRTGSSGHSHRR